MKINQRLRKLESKISTELIKIYFKDGSTELVSDGGLILLFWNREKGKQLERIEVVSKESEELCYFHKLIVEAIKI